MPVLTSMEHLWSGPCVKCVDLYNHGIFITILILTFLSLSDIRGNRNSKRFHTAVTEGGGLEGILPFGSFQSPNLSLACAAGNTGTEKG